MYSLKKNFLDQSMMIRTQVKFTKLISMSIYYQVYVTITHFITKQELKFTMNKNMISFQDVVI